MAGDMNDEYDNLCEDQSHWSGSPCTSPTVDYEVKNNNNQNEQDFKLAQELQDQSLAYELQVNIYGFI